MKRESELSAGGLRASIALIVLALAAIGVLQFSWFRQSASVEIEGVYRNLNATVAQAVSREYQRYAPLMGELRSLRSSGSRSLEFLEAFLERVIDAYGPQGITPKLLRSVSLRATRDSSIARRLDPVNRRWYEARDIPSTFPSNLGVDILRREDVGLFNARDGSVYLVCFPYRSAPYLIALQLDSGGFFERYIAPAVAGLLPDAELAWSEEPLPAPARANGGSGPADTDGRKGAPDRGFNPLRALFGGGAGAKTTFSLRLPADLDPFFQLDGPRDRDEPDGGAFRLIPIGMDIPPPSGAHIRRLSITMPSSSAIGAVERRLSFNWLFGNLLLVGVGLAFVQAMVQRRRLVLVRQREREFVASVTHELRTPLTVIMSASDNLRGGLVVGERVVEYGDLIAGQARRLGAMIEEVLLFSRTEGREPGPPPLVPVELDRLEADLRGPLHELVRGSGTRLVWDLSGLPRIFLGDPAGIGLALSNLVANAAFHAYGKGESGEIRVKGASGQGGAIVFQVEDDGRGISRSEAELVFEPFYRGEIARRRHEKGTGLGLFLARRKARSLGGDLRLESPYRRADGVRAPGCRFTLELPSGDVSDGA